jgi:murein DD-endopeptidase MepM/ murein hydrolase activator NlpD
MRYGRELRVGIGAVALALAAGSAGAAPAIEVKPTRARVGDPVLVRVRGEVGADGEARATARLGDRRFELRPGRGGLEGIVAIPLDAKAGPAPITVSGLGEGESGARAVKGSIEIGTRTSARLALTVDEDFVDPPPDARRRIAEDERAIARAYDRPEGPPLTSRPFRWPRPPKVTSQYGELRIFNGVKESDHLGVDLAGRTGDPVRAANDGEVVLARDCFESGGTILVHHGAGVYTGYFHLSEMSVAPGDEIRRGAVIGRVGATGRVTAPHLHFAVKIGGAYVDPLTFMRLGWSPQAAPADDARREAVGRAAKRARR